MVTKQKTEVSNPTKDISIQDAIPVGIPIPVFSTPNPVKSTVISPDPVTIPTPSQITPTPVVSSGGGGGYFGGGGGYGGGGISRDS
jgi:hypothetical protein